MAISSTYSTPSAPSTTLSRSYTSVDELLEGLADNTTNAIQAINIRDAVYTTYTLITGIYATLSTTFSSVYNRTNTSTYLGNVGGVLQSSTFSGTVQDALDKIFYPYVGPSALIQSLSDREFGSSTQVNLNWQVIKNSNNITSINVAGTAVVPTGLSQSGSLVVNTATHSLNPPSSEVNSFVITVSDGISSHTFSSDLTWMNRIYWGSIDLSSIGNPNLTLFPGSASQVATLCTDAVIYNLSGANANGSVIGNSLSTTKDYVYNGINANGDYLIFAWPSTVTNPYTPNFVVNGITNTAFTRVRTNSVFSNQWGFSGTNYEVWVSNTRQFSPLNIIIT